jgi:hypothetical protein
MTVHFFYKSTLFFRGPMGIHTVDIFMNDFFSEANCLLKQISQGNPQGYGGFVGNKFAHIK